MPDWPGPELIAVYDPTRPRAVSASGDDMAAKIAGWRAGQGLPVSDVLVAEVLAYARRSGRAQPGSLTEAEEQDTWGDHQRVELAQAALSDAEPVLGRVEVCWLDGRRAVRVLLTGELERYRQRLLEVLGPDRIVVDQVRFTGVQLAGFQRQVSADADELAAEGIYLTSSWSERDGLAIEYFAVDFERADRMMHERYGAFAEIGYRGASRYAIREHPFGSWLAEDRDLHVFYGLPHNGEAPAGCTAVERVDSVIVSLTILDWRGAKTLIGGFTPAHATVPLESPLGDRAVIDNSQNRSRQHWTIAAQTQFPRPQDL